jgi:integrase
LVTKIGNRKNVPFLHQLGFTQSLNQTKNGEERTVRLRERAYQTLTALGPKKCGTVFTYGGKALTGIKSSFDMARKDAEIKDFRFHDLRHTFALRLVQGGVPLYNVMHLTGHKSLEMVQRYAHLAP